MSTILGETSDREQLGRALGVLELINNGSLSQAACVAAELRIPDLLAGEPKHVDELARATGSHARSLHRLLRALTSLELCNEDDDGYFSLTPTGSLLRTDVPHSLRFWTLWWGTHQWSVWGNLLYSVRTGESARKLTTGTDDFGHLVCSSEIAALFNRAMAEFTRLVAAETLRVYDFAGLRRIVDVGGGYGVLLASILDGYPTARGVLFDLPHAVEGARTHLASAGVADRCACIAGDFFDSVPSGGDAYLLKAVIHDWNDERCTAILRNCRGAMSDGGKLLIIERVMPARVKASSAHRAITRADLNMLVALTGRERTEAEFCALLDSSGFRLANVIATGVEYSIIEALPR
jgi:hypothetical protein